MQYRLPIRVRHRLVWMNLYLYCDLWLTMVLLAHYVSGFDPWDESVKALADLMEREGVLEKVAKNTKNGFVNNLTGFDPWDESSKALADLIEKEGTMTSYPPGFPVRRSEAIRTLRRDWWTTCCLLLPRRLLLRLITSHSRPPRRTYRRDSRQTTSLTVLSTRVYRRPRLHQVRSITIFTDCICSTSGRYGFEACL